MYNAQKITLETKIAGEDIAAEWMGDTHVYLGQTDIHLHGPEANTLDGFLAKVVGYRHDTESKTSEFDLEEIIQ